MASPSFPASAPVRPPLSILDLVPRSQGMEVRQALENSRLLAVAAEEAGYRRYWVAEHHGSQTFMSSATSLLMMRALDATKTIRVGAGGVMLPNHVPLRVAEEFGTMATLHPGRLDMGLGRAPGTDPATARALRRGMWQPDGFKQSIKELLEYLGDPRGITHCAQVSGAEASLHGARVISADRPFARVRATPGEGTNVPAWILSSSVVGARIAAAMGLPYSYASHFTAADRDLALEIYRDQFDPQAATAQVQRPTLMLGVNVVVADTEAEARRLYSTALMSRAAIVSGQPGILRPPTDDLVGAVGSQELVRRVLGYAGLSAVGAPEQVVAQLADYTRQFRPDEFITLTHVYDPAARIRSVRLLAEAYGS